MGSLRYWSVALLIASPPSPCLPFPPPSAEDLARVEAMRRSGDLYTRLAHSIAPSVFGHPEIKRGILLMLFGGVTKTTVDGSISLPGKGEWPRGQ